MPFAREQIRSALLDFGALFGLFLHWLLVSLLVDAVNDRDARRNVSLYIAVVTNLVTFYLLQRSFRKIGSVEAPPETIIGVFFEIVNLAQGFGVAFCAARVWSLDDENPFHTRSLVNNQADSCFEMSLVLVGVGWASDPPVTVAERLVAWAAAYIGGLLATNMFLLTLVFERRLVWARAPPEPNFYKPVMETDANGPGGSGWTVSFAQPVVTKS